MLDYIVFHIFVFKESIQTIKESFDYLKTTDVYNNIKEILIYIKYIEKESSDILLDYFNNYDKVTIMYNEENKIYKSFLNNYLLLHTEESAKQLRIPNEKTIAILGECETISYLMFDEDLKEYTKKYNIGAFIHLRGISRNTKYNIAHKEHEPINTFKYTLSVLNKRINMLLKNNNIIKMGANSFVFKREWFNNINIEQYLEIIWNYNIVNNNPINYYNDKLFRDNERFGIKGVSHNHILKSNDSYYILDRHCFANFHDKFYHIKKTLKI